MLLKLGGWRLHACGLLVGAVERIVENLVNSCGGVLM